jgi:hypothetical protein
VRSFGYIVNRAILVAGIAGIVYPAFLEGPSGTPPPSFTQAIIALFLEPRLQLGYFMRLICLFVVIAFGYIVIIDWLYRNLPITVVQTRIKIEFNRDYRVAVVNREQILRANQDGVSAYFSEIAPTAPSGATPKADILMDASCYGSTLSNDTKMRGSDDRGYEIIHDFGINIPYRWYMPLIPAWALKREIGQIPAFLRRNLVRRTQTVVYIEDFNVENPSMSFTAANYPQRNVSVTVEFEGPIPKDFYVIRIKSRAVVKVGYHRENNHFVSLDIDRLESETLRFGW